MKKEILSLAIAIMHVFILSNKSTAQFQPTYDNHFGAEFNPTGEPMGGHCCYSQIIDPMNADFVVSTVAGFLTALSAAQPGDIIYIDDNPASYSDGIPWLDLTSQMVSGGIYIDVSNLTIASGRGRNCSNGATLAVSNVLNYPGSASLFRVRARDFRFTGLMLDGPYAGREGNVGRYVCVTTEQHPNGGIPHGIEIDNCEIKNWNYVAIRLNDLNDAHIHHNFIHHSMYGGDVDAAGYGVEVNKSKATIEGNIFDYCRHAIAGSGFIEGQWSYSGPTYYINGTRYLIRYNMFLSHIYHYPIDIHNTCHYCARDHSSYACTIPNTGGEWLIIHHNSFYTDNYSSEEQNEYLRGITIGGYPLYGGIIFNNWFKMADIPFDPPDNTSTRNDFIYISEELYTDCYNETAYDHYHWTRSTLPPSLNCIPYNSYQTLLVFDNKFGEPNACTSPVQQDWGTYANDNLNRDAYRTGDFNGDGNLDLLRISDMGEFYVILSYDLNNTNEGIGYHPGSVWGHNGGPIDIDRYKVADMNGDGLSDLVSFESNGGIYVWLNLAGTTFDSNPFSFAAYNGQSDASKYKIGDFNGDGNGDVVLFETDGGFYVWLSAGNSFNYTGMWNDQNSVTTPDRYKLGDFNGDGKTDVYYVSLTGYVNVWTSNGSSFGNVQIAYNGACMGDQYNAYKTGDINGDSQCDLLSFESDRIYVWVANANGFANSGNPQCWIYHDGTVHPDYIVSDACNSHSHRESTKNITSIDDDFIIYPNPANGIFTLEFNSENNLEKSISVIDAVGSEVLRMNDLIGPKTIIDLSSHPKGIYFIKVTGKQGVTIRKVVSM
jgi:hypothetical protein